MTNSPSSEGLPGRGPDTRTWNRFVSARVPTASWYRGVVQSSTTRRTRQWAHREVLFGASHADIQRAQECTRPPGTFGGPLDPAPKPFVSDASYNGIEMSAKSMFDEMRARAQRNRI